MSNFRIDASKMDALQNAIINYGENAENTINEAIRVEGRKEIENSILLLMPRSNRNKKHAKDSNPLKVEESNLAILFKPKKEFQYLYFPDNGENTKRHNGNQEFFYGGVERVETNVINQIINKLAEKAQEVM